MASLKRIILAGIAGTLYYTGLLRFRHFLGRLLDRKEKICVLCLHRVLAEGDQAQSNSLDGMILKEATFDRLLAYLAERFSLTSLEGLMGSNSATKNGSKPRCLLTFDDGWRDNYTTAFPLIKKHQVSATIFVTTGVVGSQSGFWVERVALLWKDPATRAQIQGQLRKAVPEIKNPPDLEEVVERCKHMPAEARQNFLRGLPPSTETTALPYASDRMMTWDQIEEMSRSGIEFGSHTVSHPLLTYENDSTVEQELAGSKQTLEKALARRVAGFAYPNGDWDERIRRWVEKCGYEFAFTVRRGWYSPGADPYTIPRFMIHEGNVTGPNGRFSPAILAFRLSGWF